MQNTPTLIASTDSLLEPLLSNDGSKVLYQLKPAYKPGEHPTSALWIAEAQKEGSSRQLTSGIYNDTKAVFHPDGKSVLFLSDRHKAGGKAQIYSLPLEQGGEAIPLTSTNSEKAVSSFKVSPDGKYVAYTSPDEPTALEKKAKEEKDDAEVWGENKDFNRLRLLSLSTRTTRTLNIRSDRHVQYITWSPDSKQILVRLTLLPGLEMSYFGGALHQTISIQEQDAQPVDIVTSGDGASTDLTWLQDGSFLQIHRLKPGTFSSSLAVRRLGDKDEPEGKAIYSGLKNDATRLVNLQHTSLVAVEVLEGVNTRLEVIDSSGEHRFTLYETRNEAISQASWDAKILEDGRFALTILRSSGPRHEVLNIWSGISNAESKPGQRISVLTKLSSHFQWLENAKPQTETTIFEWTAEDGTALEGVMISPIQAESEKKKLLPTILVIHGGPYYRDVLDYNPDGECWGHYLASAGYCILSPNYRGGSGRGTEFAEAANAGVGTLDWTDTNAMIDAAIDRKIADPARLGIAGWSQGGFMTAWGVSQTKNKFKAGVMGAGISDWSLMAAESDLPEFEIHVSGIAPWIASARSQHHRNPVNYVEDVETAVLIMHGEKDARVPATQATAFMRGLRRKAKFPERSQLVIYPREPHGFTERKHAEDVLKRVLNHFNTWLL